MTVSFEHYIHELQQIQLIQKKLTLKLETAHDFERSDRVKEAVEDLGHLDNFATSLTKTLTAKETIGRDLLIKLNHELRTPLVPIHGYTDLLLSERFGKLSDEQKNRLKVVKSNITRLEETITDLLNEKKFNVIENGKEYQSSKSSQVIKELEQEKMIWGKMVQNEGKRNIQLSRKHILTIVLSFAVIGIVIAFYSLLN